MSSAAHSLTFWRDSASGDYTLDAQLWLPLKPADVFPFFSDAHNLEAITPPWLRFSIRTPAPIAMHAGTHIDYALRVRGLPMRWRSRISAWEPPFHFVDEQCRGPYRRWIHHHRFEASEGGTLCSDHVRYAPLGGWLANALIVRHELRRIFTYRQEALLRHFGGGRVLLALAADRR